MAEYAGFGVRVTVEPEALVIARSGLEAAQARVSGDARTRRIPFALLRDVQFRDAGLREGILWLILEGRPPPEKLSSSSAMEAEDAITFRSGKQAKRMRELHEFLLRVVADNRARDGADPGPPEIEVLDDAERVSAKRLNVFREIGLRDDLADAAIALDMLPKMIKRALRAASECLADDERVEALTAGGQGVGGKATVLVLTDRRVLAVRDGASAASDVMPRREVSSVTWQEGVVGRLDIAGNGRTITVRAPDKRATGPFVERARAGATVLPRTDDVLSALERLVALRDAGALSPEEFQFQKANILRADC